MKTIRYWVGKTIEFLVRYCQKKQRLLAFLLFVHSIIDSRKQVQNVNSRLEFFGLFSFGRRIVNKC